MAYRNGTYVTFHAKGEKDPSQSDMVYYNTMRMWDAHKDIDFEFSDSHEKTQAVRDSSKKETLKTVLKTRLRNSKNMVLILTEDTRLDTDWVPFEIKYGVDECKLPIIVAYPNYYYILKPTELSYLWPEALAERINKELVKTIHIPYKKEPLLDAIKTVDVWNLPQWTITHYTRETYINWGYTILDDIFGIKNLTA